MSEWIKDYVLNKNYYFISNKDIREKIEIKCKEIESVCKKYKIDTNIKIFDEEANISINNQEADTITWKVEDDNVKFKSKNKELRMMLNGINTYTIIYKKKFEYKNTIDKAIECILEKLLH